MTETAATAAPVGGRWRLPTGVPLHLLALTAVLLLGWVVVDPEVGYFSDEGAAAFQATQLVDGGGWIYEPPLASVDPEGLGRPFLRGLTVEDGVAPYAKHPLYPVLLAGAHLLAGSAGFVLLSVAGTVLAAGGAAQLAGRRGPVRAVAALWVAGIGSPLLFDSYLVVAHTLAAAAVAWAAWALVGLVHDDPATTRRRVGLAAVAVAGVAIAVALRTEAILLCGAAAVAATALAVRDRARRRRLLGVALLVVAAVASARLLEVAAVSAIVGDAVAPLPDTTPELAERARAAWTTLLSPSRHDRAAGDLALLLSVAAAGAAGAGWALGRRPLLRGGMASAIVLVAIGALTRSPGAIPGLAVVMPVAVVAIAVAAVRRTGRGSTVTALALTLVLFAAGVIATQYSQGGGVEWGWRYLAVALPLVAVVAVHVIADDLAVDHREGRVLVGGLVALVLVLGGMAIEESRRGHAATARVAGEIDAAIAEVDAAVGGRERPVVLGVGRLLPEIFWPSVTDADWLAPDARDVGVLGERLADEGITAMVLVTPDPWRDLDALPEWHAELDRLDGDRSIWVLTLERSGEEGSS